MDQFNNKLVFTSFVFLCISIATDGVRGYASVTGSVICDQCKDGERSMFDYPVSGIKVSMTCSDGNGQIYMSRQETTNWLGGYVVRLDGTPDLSNCYVQVSDSGADSGSGSGSGGCTKPASPAQKVTLMFSMFGMEMYNAESLLTQPSQPMSFCPKPTTPVPVPVPNVPPMTSPPQFRLPPLSPLPPMTSPPQFRLPPLPPLPPMPPMPFVEASACSHQYWIRPEYKCYWRALSPDTKIAVVFGLIAGRRYGNDITLWGALNGGRGEAYKTLLREATAALLNSYNSLHFPYSPLAVITNTNIALAHNSQHDVLMTALRFIRANSGSGNVPCRFTPCH